MSIKKLHHIGIIVEDLDRGIEKFKGFGFTCTEVMELKDAGVKIAFFPLGETLIELLHFDPEKRQGAVGDPKRGAINHICFAVDDLDAAIGDFEKNGARLMDGFPQTLPMGRIAFFEPESTENALIELLQK